MKYLKVYNDTIQSGRDIGYSCTRTEIYDSIDDLARNYGKNRGERYYELKSMDSRLLDKEVNDFLKKQEQEKKKEEKDKKLKEYNELKKELGID